MKLFDDNLRVAEARHGSIMYNRNCRWIGQSIETYGEYSEDEVGIFAQLIRPGDSVWEIGTNIGVHAVPLAKLCKPGKFYGFEPQPELCKIANANLVLNGCNNAQMFNYGIGSRNDIGTFVEPDYGNIGNFGGVSINDGGSRGCPVEIRSIDSLNWLDKPDLIKIDVEGMEKEVLIGGKKTIAKHRPIIFTENDRKEKSRDLIAYFKSLKYDTYWHVSPLYSQDNFFKFEKDIFNIVSINMLCVPAERDIKLSNFAVADDKSYWPLS